MIMFVSELHLKAVMLAMDNVTSICTMDFEVCVCMGGCGGGQFVL